jgi:hypothetical protein
MQVLGYHYFCLVMHILLSHDNVYYLMQNVVDFGTNLQKINVTKSVFNPPSGSTLSGKVLYSSSIQ